jgi:hypothetical protein
LPRKVEVYNWEGGLWAKKKTYNHDVNMNLGIKVETSDGIIALSRSNVSPNQFVYTTILKWMYSPAEGWHWYEKNFGDMGMQWGV